jgi:hypothetical protein
VSVCPSVHLSVYVSVCLSVHLSVYVSVCLSVHLSVIHCVVVNEASSPSHPMTLNLSEFPALSQRGVSVSTASSFIPGGSTGFSSSSMPLPSRSSYAGFVTKPPEQPQEFQMHHEDFPALPGASRPTGNSSQQIPLLKCIHICFKLRNSWK